MATHGQAHSAVSASEMPRLALNVSYAETREYPRRRLRFPAIVHPTLSSRRALTLATARNSMTFGGSWFHLFGPCALDLL
jgi:hypothetical protein